MSSYNYPSLSCLLDLQEWATDDVVHCAHYCPEDRDRSLAFYDWITGLIQRHPEAIIQRRVVQYVWRSAIYDSATWLAQRDAYWEADYVH